MTLTVKWICQVCGEAHYEFGYNEEAAKRLEELEKEGIDPHARCSRCRCYRRG